MGYTHYVYVPAQFDPEKFKQWRDEVVRLKEALPPHIKIAGWDGKGKPEFSDTEVVFNGLGPDEDHETFRVDQTFTPGLRYDCKDEHGRYFTFCKTARKPYDLLVVAALIQLNRWFPRAVEIASDGWREEWQDGQDFVERVLGEDAGFMPPRPWCGSYNNPKGPDSYRKKSPRHEYDAAKRAWKAARAQSAGEEAHAD